MGLEEPLPDHHRIAELLRGAAVGTWSCDLPLDRIAIDAQASAHFHLGPHTTTVALGALFDRVHPDDRSRLEASIESCIAARLPFDSEFRAVSTEGANVTWVRMIGRASYDAA